MNSEEYYKQQLIEIIQKYRVHSVLDLGVHEGVSTEIFLDAGLQVVSVDIEPCIKTVSRIRDKRLDTNWTFIQKDIDDAISMFSKGQFGMIFYDITYYDQNKLEYGSPDAYVYEVKCGRRDLSKLMRLLSRGQIICQNDYLNSCGHRRAPRDVWDEYVTEKRFNFEVYSNRGGIAVYQNNAK